jgi:hypothetical protein
LGAFGGGVVEGWNCGIEGTGEMIGAIDIIGVTDAFSASYAAARVKFLEAAATASLQIESFNASALGQKGEVMALDVALQKTASSKAADNLLIISSVANQGADRMAGSGVQVYILHDAEWMDKVRASGISVLYLHGVEQSLADVVKKQVAQAKKVTLIDLSASHSLKAVVFPALSDANLAEKCTFSVVKSIPATEPVWQGQTISLARQALFKAVDALHKI